MMDHQQETGFFVAGVAVLFRDDVHGPGRAVDVPELVARLPPAVPLAAPGQGPAAVRPPAAALLSATKAHRTM